MSWGGPDAVLLTHGHWDHVHGLDRLKEDFPDVPVYMPEDGRDFLKDSSLNGSLLNDFEEIVESDVAPIREGELEVGGYDVAVTDTPGHCRGCVVYYFTDEDVLFSGDTILRDVVSPIRMTGSEEAQKASIRKFVRLGYPDATPVHPGHGASTTYGYLLEHSEEVKKAQR